MFFKKKKKVLSIDIGSNSIKILLTTGTVGDDFEIVDYRYVQTNTTGKPLSLENDIACLTSILEEFKGQYDQVRTIITGNDVIARVIEIQSINSKDLKRVVGLQLERFIPLKPGEVVFDCVRIDDENIREGFQKCLLIAIPKKTHKKFVDNLRKINLQPILIDSETPAVINSYLAFSSSFNRSRGLKLSDNDGTVILHIGASHAEMIALKDNKPIMCRNIPYGYSSLANMMMSQTQKSYLEVNEIIINSLEYDSETQTVIDNYVYRLAHEVRTSLDYCRREYDLLTQRVYLTGGVARNSFISEELAKKLEVEIYSFNPFESIFMPKIEHLISEFKSKSFAFVPTLGIAIREVKI